MKIKFSFGRRAALGLSMLALPMASASLEAANLEGRWIQHPAAALRSGAKESQVDRIIEGNRYVYFCVRGGYFKWGPNPDNYSNRNNIQTLQVFRQDKDQDLGESSIRPLTQDFELSGVSPRILNYSPTTGVLALVDETNAIDFIYDDGTHISSRALQDVTFPLSVMTPYSITFDDENQVVYIAGSFGYAVINYKTGELQSFVKTDKPVSWASRVGDNIVLFAGEITSTYFSPPGGEEGSVVQSKYNTETYIFPIPQNEEIILNSPIEGMENLQAIMPLSDSSFAAIAREASDTNKSLVLFTVSDNGVSKETLVKSITADNGATYTYRYQFHTDGCVQNGTDGYVIQSQDQMVILHKDGSLKTRSKSSLSASEKASKAASLDGSKLWLYTYATNGLNDSDKRGFYTYEFNNEGWTHKSEVATVNAPTCTFAAFAEWNPEYGLLVRGQGSLFSHQDRDADRLCGYKNGIWTELNYSANNPKYQLPVNAAKNVRTDPLNPSWIWGDSNRAGLHRMDLNNYDNFLEFGSTKYQNYKTLYPGYFPIFEYQTQYLEILAFSNVDFDNEGRMWFARYFYTDAEDYSSEYVYNAQTPVYYLTQEEREQIAKIGADESKLPDIKGREIIVPRNKLNYNCKLLSLKSPENSNLLVFSHGGMEGSQKCTYDFIYDHNGTPDDQTDDRYVLLNDLVDENGEKVTFRTQSGLYEDLNTGEIWMLTSSGPFIMDPQEILFGGKSCRRHRITKRDGMNVDESPLNFIEINYISDDYLGRKWLATQEGLYCLSKDALELLGHYTPENSPLPSRNVLNVVCSPEGIVFALTTKGLVEFHPEGSKSKVEVGTHLTVWPTTVGPDYNGYVTVTGAETGSEYIVCDKEGNEIVTLGIPDSSNALQWNCNNHEGKRAASGRYIIKRRNVEEENAVIIL